ncbi:tetratricopeptide repeat protein [Sphingobium sp. KCTC 72723]|uniref:tetratricopeptide repeat protein n=1 Tax=Sphingobium sp. KCTC 72723 TaxID=2733867 RepID=UPI0021D0C6B3|nr:SPOR domain-containing protein [Sphingobium sp. KCTC 72723]
MKLFFPSFLCGLLLASGAQAQTDQSQLVRPLGAADLNANLARLAGNPRDVTALIGAGEAALALDDPRAAAGFYARADAIESGNGRIKAGLARVNLKLQNPAEALRLFDQAGRLGYPDATLLADRGLARDMTGDQAGAQRDYQAALQKTPDDAELIRRYAASLGIAGQVEASDNVMQPLFYKSDRAAWRYRAFILAMNNRQDDARKIAVQTMPAQLAAAITPYMAKMPYLTPAQKAAAVHFGHFPTQIGTSIAAVTPTAPAPGNVAPVVAAAPVVVAAAPTRPARGETMQDRRARRAEEQRLRREATRVARAQTTPATPVAAPVQTIARAPAPQPASLAATAVAPRPMVQPTPAPTPAPSPVPPATPPAQTVQPTPAPVDPVRQAMAPSGPVQGPPAPGFDSVDMPPASAPAASQPAPAQALNAITLAQSSVPASVPAPAATPPAQETAAPPPAAAPQPDPQATRTLADIIRAIDVPDAERQSSVAAVDLTEIAALQAARRAERQSAAALAADKAKKAALAKAKAEADAKAKKEAEEKKKLAANPARNWLQVGTGASKSGLSFTMKALRKKYDSLSAQDGWSASWGRTNRLLVGPFPGFARAKALEDKIKAAGGDAFAWKSDAGEVVERLGGQ